jgi:N-acetylglucosamine-6-sulfatase
MPALPFRCDVGMVRTVRGSRIDGKPTQCVLASSTLALLIIVLSAGPISSHPRKSPARPNILIILTDDQRWDSMDQMPQLNAAPEWAHFSNAFVDEPQCCPSRASILTGRYPQHTRVETLRDGKDMNDKRTIATMLHSAGYRTGLYGKYLNGYPFGRKPYTPPGWDSFVAGVGPEDYYNYKLNENGHIVAYGSEPKDYRTDVLTEKTRRFINTTKPSQPFFVYLAPNAPHTDSKNRVVPAEQDRQVCSGRAFPEPPNFNAYDSVSEPPWMAAEQPKQASNMAIRRAGTCNTLQGVDRSVASIVGELEREGRLKNTYVAFTSDNGYAFGEHRLVGKGDLYEPSVRVPLLVRGPTVQPGTVDRLTSNVDLVPTILDWAKVQAPTHFLDGTSFADDLSGKERRDPREVLLRGCRTQAGPGDDCGGYPSNMGFNWGLRTATHKYVEYPDGYVQLFDLTNDPWELTNLAPDPNHAPLVAELHARLERLRAR